MVMFDVALVGLYDKPERSAFALSHNVAMVEVGFYEFEYPVVGVFATENYVPLGLHFFD